MEGRIATGLSAVAAVLLAGCLGAAPPPTAGGNEAGRTGAAPRPPLFSFRKVPRTIRVVRRKVTIAGPAGYCIDKSASTNGTDGAFVLLASCAAISEDPREAHPRLPAVLTASVSPPGAQAAPGELARLEAFFKSAEGRAALSRSGKAETVQIHHVARDGEALLIHVSDTSPNGLNAVVGNYWRGFFEVNRVFQPAAGPRGWA
jgi:hypothetical protein